MSRKINEKVQLKTDLLKFSYKQVLKPVFFMSDAERVHNNMTSLGAFLGRNTIGREFLYTFFDYENEKLSQQIDGLSFENPIGLAAGFDYNAQLTQVVPGLGFGFATVGTITNSSYNGNPSPRLGRLPKSKSLLVNKGFKNKGAVEIVKHLKSLSFKIPTGISIGRTNSSELKTLEQSIEDIESAFEVIEKAKIKSQYYELNISCPNLIHGGRKITFYPPQNLEKLLKMIDKLKLTKPVYIKMPITESDGDFVRMLDVVVRHKINGVIVGNLEKNRKNPVLVKSEMEKVGVGNFSGMPCKRRSNELISLAYKTTQGKLTIIGCGGVFSEYDAYEKVKRGASLVSMITGLVYEGPQVVGGINRGLVRLLKEDGYASIGEARGSYYG